MKVFLDSVGCRLNQSEIETYALQFRAAGHTIVGSPEEAEMVVINTCAVTAQAAADSRGKTRRAARLMRPDGKVVLTGCWSTLDPGAAALLPGVSRLVPNLEKDRLVLQMLHLPEEEFDLEPLARAPLPGLHLRTRAFIKVQDGCNNHCTFCVTRLARGAGRSRTVDEVQRDCGGAVAGGARELVLSGVHLGSWGSDFQPPLHLEDLVAALLRMDGFDRLRLSSLEPWDISPAFIDQFADPRLCEHLHLPLQSGCGATLRRMARNTTPENFARLLVDIRRRAPEIAFTTDVIVGFPGETQAEFEESLEFVRAMHFAGGHVFSYSARPGTAAARLPNQVPAGARKERSERMRAAFAASSRAYQERFLGRQVEVLWESTDQYGPDGWRLQGLTGNYLKVTASYPERLWNQLSTVRLTGLDEDRLAGEILD